jgi:alpha-glucoside transport system substrate-binding protein
MKSFFSNLTQAQAMLLVGLITVILGGTLTGYVQLRQTQIPIEATQTAEAKQTLIAQVTATQIPTRENNGDDILVTNTPSPTPTLEPTPTNPPDLHGKIVTVYGAFTDQDETLFHEAMVPFEEKTGIIIEYEGKRETFDQVFERMTSDNLPDIIISPQPGVVQDLVNRGYVTDLNTIFDQAYLGQQYDQVWLDMANMNGTMAGVWYKAFTKSLVWYPASEFEQAGYQIPETWNEMIALSDQMVTDGRVPWCEGIESGDASGWPATDWIEDIMLRTTSPQNYDRWLTGELKFNSPEVERAFEIAGQIWFEPNYVYGGRQAINSTFFGDAPSPMFDNPPGCWFYRQGDFITAFFPSSTVVGRDVDFFYLPPIDFQYGKPLLISGDLAVMINDRPEVRELVRYLSTAESVKVLMEEGVAISPHKDANEAWYGTNTYKRIAEIFNDADTLRFDGSDMMPGEVGAGSFWWEVRQYVDGKKLDEVLRDIDASWP